MKIDRISYSESHESMSPLGLKKWRKMGAEAQLEEGDKFSECMIELEANVQVMLGEVPKTGTNGEDFPYSPQQLFNGAQVSALNPPIRSIDYKAKDRLLKLIVESKTKDELSKFKEDAQKHDLGDEYDAKLNLLSK